MIAHVLNLSAILALTWWRGWKYVAIGAAVVAWVAAAHWQVAVLSETGYEALPLAAVERLGLVPGQKNVLVRLVIRPFHRTLSDAEANRIRNRVYAALHRGTAKQWAE